MFSWIPEAASTVAGRVDNVILAITIITVFFFVLITALLIIFSIKYRKKSDNDETPYLTHNTVIETIWTVIPTILVILIFFHGYVVYKEMRIPPEDAIEINAVGKQWLWEFEYYNGKKTINELVVQQNKPVKLILRSDDVLHSFFVPDFRVKQDNVPGMYNQLWFTPNKVGTFDIFCAEYCGTGHSAMLGKVVVLSPEAYTRWEKGDTLEDGEKKVAVVPTADAGKKLLASRGCNACHSVDGTDGVGPTLKGLFGKTETLQDGQQVEVDENYLRESLLEPEAKMVQGYQPVMPSFKGVLNEDEITSIIVYIKSIK